MDPAGLKSKATDLFRQTKYTEALKVYEELVESLHSGADTAGLCHALLKKASCHLRLKDFMNVVKDCDEVLLVDGSNVAALSRKLKALCSLNEFVKAHSVAENWSRIEPKSEAAQRELERLRIVVGALQDLDNEDMLDDSSEMPPHADTDCHGNTSDGGRKDLDDKRSSPEGQEDEHSSSPATLPSNTSIKGKCGSGCVGAGCETCEVWQHRPPPRGLTGTEYTKCHRYFGEGTCRFGDQCMQAHSDSELVEWCRRFEFRRQQLQRQKDSGNEFAQQLAEKLATVENSETLMVETVDGVNVHVSHDLAVSVSSKKSSHEWLFTVTSKFKMHQMALLDDTTRKYYHISLITIGPKRTQKSQFLEPHCQYWTSSNSTDSKVNTEQVFRIKVAFQTDIYGTFRQSLVFDFGSEPVVFRNMCVESTKTNVDIEQLSQTLKLTERGRWDLSTMTVVDFVPPAFIIDEDVYAIMNKYPVPMVTKFSMSPSLLDPEMNSSNYCERQHSLLYIEEMAQFSSIAKFNLRITLQMVDRFLLMPSGSVSTAKFAQNGELYARMKLNSDISEDTVHGRLVLQSVSTVYLSPWDPEMQPHSKPEKVYEGFVEEKGKNFIFIRISQQCVRELRLRKDTEFNAEVQFHLNRIPLCEMHHGVDRLPDMHTLFPDVADNSSIPWNPGRQWKDKLDTRLNAKQREAIVAMTTELSISLPPILIVGPYGTGKTFTLAQATKEILSQPNTRILICTHSNSAADLYIKDYLHPYVEEGHEEAKPLRIYYKHRWAQTVHYAVLPYALKDSKTGTFRAPTTEDVEAVRVVVSTLTTARYICDLNLEPGFFTHILLDEAAQAMECEILIPLALAGPHTRVALAGDHMQLSPEIHSEFAKERKFHLSLLERLYDHYPGTHGCKILLVENYRSHKAIISFTSEVFYDNMLVASGNQAPHGKFYPLSFFTAHGEEVQHQNSTTFYNNAEVFELVERVAEVVDAWPEAWGPKNEAEIGVVSPYSDQVIRIRSELRKKNLRSVSVERVLNVQGKQFRAIFLSTVRTKHTCSMDSALEEMMDYGFLSNSKLLNTAITRAQSLVAVVGDPVALCSIGKCRKLWERFLEMCQADNSLYGITWSHLRGQLDGVELKKTYILNPNAPEFIPNRLRHGPVKPPEPIAFGRYGYMFVPQGPMSPHRQFMQRVSVPRGRFFSPAVSQVCWPPGSAAAAGPPITAGYRAYSPQIHPARMVAARQPHLVRHPVSVTTAHAPSAALSSPTATVAPTANKPTNKPLTARERPTVQQGAAPVATTPRVMTFPMAAAPMVNMVRPLGSPVFSGNQQMMLGVVPPPMYVMGSSPPAPHMVHLTHTRQPTLEEHLKASYLGAPAQMAPTNPRPRAPPPPMTHNSPVLSPASVVYNNPKVQFLPSACNIRPAGPTMKRDPTPAPITNYAGVRAPEPTQSHMRDPLQHVPGLQRELISYMMHTEGSNAAHNYMQQLQASTIAGTENTQAPAATSHAQHNAWAVPRRGHLVTHGGVMPLAAPQMSGFHNGFVNPVHPPNNVTSHPAPLSTQSRMSAPSNHYSIQRTPHWSDMDVTLPSLKQSRSRSSPSPSASAAATTAANPSQSQHSPSPWSLGTEQGLLMTLPGPNSKPSSPCLPSRPSPYPSPRPLTPHMDNMVLAALQEADPSIISASGLPPMVRGTPLYPHKPAPSEPPYQATQRMSDPAPPQRQTSADMEQVQSELAENIVRFLQQDQDAVHSITTAMTDVSAHSPSSGSRSVPLYLRGQGGGESARNNLAESTSPASRRPGLSYAGALRRPLVASPDMTAASTLPYNFQTSPQLLQAAPNPPCNSNGFNNMSADPDADMDPMEVLRNLQIKDSPGTHAFYKYFS